MDTFGIGSHVRTATRGREVGTVVRHHPTLPAWIVRFGHEAFPLAYYYATLERA